ncbi:flagellar hook-associated protein [Sporolactobacillus sp. THM7-7]|nr:flagellar hook-associated protein [Sporolactobacillus sp. THM7-7]
MVDSVGSATSTSSNYYLLNTGRNSSLQVSGLASGIDVDSIVNKLMQAESVPLDRMNQQLQLLEWKRDDYRSMNDLLGKLQSVMSTMALQSSYAKTAAISDPTKVSVTAGTGAGNATFTLTNATLATAATNATQFSDGSTSIVKTGSSFDSSKPLIEQAGNLANSVNWKSNTISDTTPESITVSADGFEFQLANGAVDSAAANQVTVTDASNTTTTYNIVYSQSDLYNASPDTPTVYIDPTTGHMTFNQQINKGSTISASYTYKTVNLNLETFDSNGNKIDKSLSLNGSLSLDSMLQKLNASGAGVNAFYDSASQRVSISTTQTGHVNPDSNGKEMIFNYNNDAYDLFRTLGLSPSNEQGGTDAAFTLNGMETTRHSNTFTVNNTTFTLNEAIPSTQIVTVGISTDTDSVLKQITDFVDQYNEAIQKINDMINTPPNRDYPPLTAAQKAQMKDSDITNWNEIARKGTLYGDNILRGALSQMRQDLYSPVSGLSGLPGNMGSSYNQLAQIGITTSRDYLEHGKLVIDENKLREAISADPAGVMQLFTNGNSNSTDSASMGIAKRLYNTLTDTMSRVKEQAGNPTMVNNQFNIGRSIDDMNDEIASFQDHLKVIQTRYYRQFSAMESAIEQANSQALYLQNMLS